MSMSKCQWLNELNGNTLHLYRCFTNDIFADTYVSIMMPFGHGRYVAMLRCGSPPLEVELGCRSNTLSINKICKLLEQRLENEVQLMLECPIIHYA